jgi:hypothetical protein
MTSRSTRTGILAAALLAAAYPVFAQKGPAATTAHLPPEILSLACAPRAVYQAPAMPLKVTGGQDSFVRRIHGPGDLVTINAGKKNGIEVGQEFYVRRLQVDEQSVSITRTTPGTVRTTGWIKVYAVDDEWSLVTVSHACDTIEIGDFLEPFALPTVPQVAKDRPKPQRGNYAKVVGGDDRRTTFGAGDYLVINHGSDHGIERGSQFVLYRNKEQPQNFLYELGEAIAVDVKPELTTLHVTMSIDSIQVGDLVALRKAAPEQK